VPQGIAALFGIRPFRIFVVNLAIKRFSSSITVIVTLAEREAFEFLASHFGYCKPAIMLLGPKVLFIHRRESHNAVFNSFTNWIDELNVSFPKRSSWWLVFVCGAYRL
jgi:hypothetical protein